MESESRTSHVRINLTCRYSTTRNLRSRYTVCSDRKLVASVNCKVSRVILNIEDVAYCVVGESYAHYVRVQLNASY